MLYSALLRESSTMGVCPFGNPPPCLLMMLLLFGEINIFFFAGHGWVDYDSGSVDAISDRRYKCR